MKAEKNLQYPVVQSISKRWSPRAFSDKKIPTSEVKSLFEAARWAASARNQQPWLFIWAGKDQPELHNQLMECMVAWNQSWAKTADVLILCFARVKTGEKNYPNETALYDLGLAMGNMTTQAMENGIYLHHMAGLEFDVIEKNFQYPEVYKPVCMVAAGYPGDVAHIPADIAQNEYNEQIRKEQDEFVFNSLPEWK